MLIMHDRSNNFNLGIQKYIFFKKHFSLSLMH